MATYVNADDQFVAVGADRLAYRKLGPPHGVPLLMLMGFRRAMDHWDPALVNALASYRPVMLMDNPGVGRSAGPVPKTYGAWAQIVIDFLSALGVAQVDLLGYSMGGCVAQMVTLNGAGVVRRLVLAGTSPSTGPGVRQYRTREELATFAMLSAAATEEQHRAAFLAGFFTPTPRSQAAGAASWKRISAGRPGREVVDSLGPEGARRQGIAFAKFMDPKQASDGSFDRLGDIKIPVLIAGGKTDLLLPTENNVVMYNRLRDAHLHLFPDSGHGFLYQYADEFAALIHRFLDDTSRDGAESKL